MAAREECTCGKIPYQWARLVDPECKAVHHDETHGYHTADGDEVLGRYYERVGPAFVEEPVVERLKEALITIADRLEDKGCQCDVSDEYTYRCNLCTANDALRSTIPPLNPDKG